MPALVCFPATQHLEPRGMAAIPFRPPQGMYNEDLLSTSLCCLSASALVALSLLMLPSKRDDVRLLLTYCWRFGPVCGAGSAGQVHRSNVYCCAQDCNHNLWA